MYKIKTPNPRYSGVTEGVAFVGGVGYTESKVTRNILVNDYKYDDISEDTSKKDEAPEKSIDEMTVPELKEKAKKLELTGFSNLKRDELIALIKGEPPEDDGENPKNEGEPPVNSENGENNNDPNGAENLPENTEGQ